MQLFHGKLGFFRVDKTKEIITELKRSYAIELETMQNYLANSIDLEGAEAELVRKSLEEEITLKLKHARRLAKRINVLGVVSRARWSCPRSEFVATTVGQRRCHGSDPGVIGANEASINQYQKIISLTEGLDYVTQDMVIDLLSDEREHRRLFLSFLTQMRVVYSFQAWRTRKRIGFLSATLSISRSSEMPHRGLSSPIGTPWQNSRISRAKRFPGRTAQRNSSAAFCSTA